MRSRSRKNILHAESFTNVFGQVINPGDPVMYAASSYKSTYHKKAFFSGVNKDKNNTIMSVRVFYPSVKYVPNGKTETVTYKTMDYYTRQEVEKSYVRKLYDEVPSTGYSTLPLMRVFKLAE